MRKIRNLLISFVCLLGLISPLVKDNDSDELSFVFATSINNEVTKQNLSNSYTSIYDELASGVVSVLNFSKVNGNEKLSSFGSGFAYYQDTSLSPYIYFISNNHVVSDASSIYVVTNYNQRVKAEVIGVDPYQDCSVIRVKKSSFTKTIKILDLYKDNDGNFINPAVGDNCFAIGTPADITFRNTLTCGIVSGINRIVVQDNDDIFNQSHAIQTDCPINPGNSGGPLFNSDGKVIGVNTLKLQTDNGYELEGLNFSLPINDMYKTAEKIRTLYSTKFSKITLSTRVSLSSQTKYISIRELNLNKRISYGVEGLNKGVVLMYNDTELGLNKHSVIVSINNQPIDNVVELRRYLLDQSANKVVSVQVYKSVNNKLDSSISNIDVSLKEISLKEVEDE